LTILVRNSLPTTACFDPALARTIAVKVILVSNNNRGVCSLICEPHR
jgi:hypothetical protein